MPNAYRQLYRHLLAHFGPQQWWPAKTSFEVMVGAILTQNTAWTNVEKAIANLLTSNALSPESIIALSDDELASIIRPSGYFNIKARRLKHLCHWLQQQGGELVLRQWDDQRLREGLLGVNGIGPETADDILLYAFGRPIFVIDAYTRRLFARLGLATGQETYDHLRLQVEAAFAGDKDAVSVFNELHALIVIHAKLFCRKRPQCTGCPLQEGCTYDDQ